MSGDSSPLRTLEQSLSRKEVAPLYLFYGEEDFLVDEAVHAVVERAVDESARSFDLDRMQGRESDANGVLSRISSYPMMGERRVVVVREVDKLANLEQLLPAAEDPRTSNSLVMTASRPDFRLKFFRAVKEKGLVLEFRRLYENEVSEWARKRIRALGKEPTSEACQLIQSYVGRSLRDVNNELEKVVLYVGDRATIGADDVNSVVGFSRQYNIFELQKAVGQQNIARSIEILENMLRRGESPVWMIVMLTRYLMKLWLLQEFLGKRIPQAQLPERLGVTPFAVRDYLSAVGKFSADELRRCFSALIEADETLKSSSMDQRLVMTVLVCKLTAAG